MDELDRLIGSLQAEKAALACCLLDPDVLAHAAMLLSPADFRKEAHRLVFRGLLSLWAPGRRVDLVHLLDEMDRTGSYESVGGDVFFLEMIHSVPCAANGRRYVEIVKRAGLKGPGPKGGA